MLVDQRPALVLNDRGVFYRPWRVGTVLWRDIEDAYVQVAANETFICLRLFEPEEYFQQMSRLRRSMTSMNASLGFTEFTIHAGILNQPVADVLEYILKAIESRRREDSDDLRTSESIRVMPPSNRHL